MLLIPLPAWLALGILQLPLGSSQVRIHLPSPPAPQQTSLYGLLSTHLSCPSTSTPRVGVWHSHSTCGAARARGMVTGLFPCSSEIRLNALRVCSFSTASKCRSRTGRWGLRLEQTWSQGQTPSRMGRDSVQGRTSKSTPKMLPAWKGPPRLWQGGRGIQRVIGVSS